MAILVSTYTIQFYNDIKQFVFELSEEFSCDKKKEFESTIVTVNESSVFESLTFYRK